MEQITLGIAIDRADPPPPFMPGPEQRRKLVDLMAAAIAAVNRADEQDPAEEHGDE